MNPVEQFKSLKDSLLSSIENVSDLLSDFSRIGISFDPSTHLKNLAQIQSRLAADNFKVLVVGEFSTGKSTFLNALLKESILPTEVSETTATINIIKYSDDPRIEIHYWGEKDDSGAELSEGRTQTIPFDAEELIKYTTSLEEEYNENAKSIKYVNVYYPTEFCRDDVELVDTPGLNSTIGFHEKITLDYLENGHCAIMLLKATMLFSKSEIDYLKKFQKYINKILFVVNKIDKLNGDFYSAEYKQARLRKVRENFSRETDFEYFPLSAKKATQDGWEASGFDGFVNSFREFLVSGEKAREMIIPPIMQTLHVSGAVINQLEILNSGISFSPEEFEKLIQQNFPKLQKVQASISELSGFLDVKIEQLEQKYVQSSEIELESAMRHLRENIIGWDSDLQSLEEELPHLVKKSVIDAFECIKETIKSDITVLKNQCAQRFSSFFRDIDSYKSSLSFNVGPGEFSLEKYAGNDPGDMLKILAGGAGIGLAIGTIIAGPIGIAISLIGGGFFGKFAEEKQKAKKLEKIAFEITQKMSQKLRSEVPKGKKEIRKSLTEFKETVVSRMNEELKNIEYTIESVRKERDAEKSRTEMKKQQIQGFISNIKAIEETLKSVRSELKEQL
jgi:GTPase SAR1 family protein